MNFKKETIYIKAKQLRQMICDASNSSFFEDADLRKRLNKLNLEFPIQIGFGVNFNSIEETRMHLIEAEKILIELLITLDLNESDYFQIDSAKLDSLVDEIFELIPLTIAKAEEEEEKRMSELMKEVMVKETE